VKGAINVRTSVHFIKKVNFLPNRKHQHETRAASKLQSTKRLVTNCGWSSSVSLLVIHKLQSCLCYL